MTGNITFPEYKSLPRTVKTNIKKRLRQLYGDFEQSDSGSVWRPGENFPVALLTIHTNQEMFIIDIWESPTGQDYRQLEKLRFNTTTQLQKVA